MGYAARIYNLGSSCRITKIYHKMKLNGRIINIRADQFLRANFILFRIDKHMWIISFDSFCYVFSWAPLEIKLWMLQTFFGVRCGTILCWLVYQASLERGSLRTITYNPAYDKSIWTSAMEYIVHAPLGLISSSSYSYFGRMLTDALGHVAKSSRHYGLIAPRKPQLALTSPWEIIEVE